MRQEAGQKDEVLVHLSSVLKVLIVDRRNLRGALGAAGPSGSVLLARLASRRAAAPFGTEVVGARLR